MANVILPRLSGMLNETGRIIKWRIMSAMLKNPYTIRKVYMSAIAILIKMK